MYWCEVTVLKTSQRTDHENDGQFMVISTDFRKVPHETTTVIRGNTPRELTSGI